MEEVLPLLWVLDILSLDLSGGNNGTRVRINDLLPFVISLCLVLAQDQDMHLIRFLQFGHQ